MRLDMMDSMQQYRFYNNNYLEYESRFRMEEMGFASSYSGNC